jgi:hypothetical protein
VSWCPSCFIQIGEVAMPAYAASTGQQMPFEIAPLAELFAERLDDLRPLFTHRVEKRVALQERSAVPSIMVAVKQVLRAIPGLPRRARCAGDEHPGEPPRGAAAIQGRTAPA